MDQQNEISLYESPAGILENRRAQELTSTEAGERQELPGLLEYWRIIRERRATIVTILFVFFPSGLIAPLKEKPVYRGRGLIEIQMENPDIPTLQELFQV